MFSFQFRHTESSRQVTGSILWAIPVMVGILARRFCRDYRGQLRRITKPQQSSDKLTGSTKSIAYQIRLAKTMHGTQRRKDYSRVLFGTVLAKKRGGSESSSPGPEASLGVSCRSDLKVRQRPELRRKIPQLLR